LVLWLFSAFNMGISITPITVIQWGTTLFCNVARLAQRQADDQEASRQYAVQNGHAATVATSLATGAADFTRTSAAVATFSPDCVAAIHATRYCIAYVSSRPKGQGPTSPCCFFIYRLLPGNSIKAPIRDKRAFTVPARAPLPNACSNIHVRRTSRAAGVVSTRWSGKGIRADKTTTVLRWPTRKTCRNAAWRNSPARRST